MAQISITRALTEVKNLGEQINKFVTSNRFVAVAKGKGDRKVVPGLNKTVSEVEATLKSNLQQVQDLIKRRKTLKDLIQQSNAYTCVVIAGESMTVQQAIERKQSIGYEKALYEAVRQQFVNGLNEVQRQQMQLDAQIDKAVEAAYANDKTKISAEQYDLIAMPRRNEHEPSLIDPLDCDKWLRETGEQLNAFITEVDFVLSESNAKTTVEV